MNNCNHNSMFEVHLCEFDGTRTTYCFKCLFEKIGLEPKMIIQGERKRTEGGTTEW